MKLTVNMKISKRTAILRIGILFTIFAFGVLKINAQNIKEAIQDEELLKYQAAKSIYNQLLAKDASNAEVYYHLGVIAYHNYQYDSANYYFGKGIQLNANEPLNYIGTGLMKLHNKNQPQAKADFDKALSVSASGTAEKTSYVEQQIVEAMWQEQDGQDADYALDLAQKAVKADDKNLRYKISIGDAYILKGDGGNGIRQYESVEDANPKYYLATLKVGHCYASPSARNYDAALEQFQKIVSADPKYAPVYPEMADAYSQKNPPQNEKAKESYLTFLLLVGSSPAERLQYAKFLYYIKDYKAALEQLNIAYQFLPDNIVLLKLKAYCEDETKDPKTGLATIQRMFSKARPDEIKGMDYEYFGRLLATGNQDSMAIVNLYKAYKDDSSKVYLLDSIAGCYAKMKKYSKAAQVIEQKIIRTKDNVNGLDYYTLARYYLVLGNYTKADTNAALLIKQYPDYPVGYYYRALCNANIDSTMKTGAAKPYYEQFISKIKTANDSATYKSQVIEANMYMVSYYYNKNDYTKAKEYGLKVKVLDPANKQNNSILKYIEDILKKKK
jgi:tetratricopeptide (TPR) repeat protein